MAFLAYLQENATLVLSRGEAFVGVHTFLSLNVGFLYEPPRPHRGAFSAIPKKTSNAWGDGHAWN